MKRTKPCRDCKRIRRKCERPPGKSSCLRCTQLNLNCLYGTSTSEDTCIPGQTSDEDKMAEVDGTPELQDLAQYVEEVERKLQHLQLQLDQRRQHDISTQEDIISKIDSLPIPNEWNFTIINGHLRLETGINTLSDLLQYQLLESSATRSIRYLSPFSKLTPVYFRLEQESMFSRAVQLLTNHGVFDGSFKSHSNGPSDSCSDNGAIGWSPKHQHLIDLHSTNSVLSSDYRLQIPRPLVLPSTLFASTSFCPELMVDILVTQYFKCYNLPLPMLHESTYMAKYNKQTHHSSINGSAARTESTTSSFIYQLDPITLAICCHMSVSFCKHLPLTVYQKREYGEYFYVTCREKIDELYDNPCPHQQLQVLIAINLLIKFMGLTLRLKDGRKLATIGYLISFELSKHAASPNTTFDSVEKGLATRHTIFVSIIFGLTEFVYTQRMDDIMPGKVRLDVLPGESDATASMLRLFECIFDLVLHRDCIVMVHQLRRITIGEVSQISLESVVRFDNLCMEWWKNLPDEWRYYGNPYDASVKQVIEQCENEQALVIHSFLLSLTLGIHSILLHPQNLQEYISELVQQRALVVTLNCCNLLMAVADRLKVVSKHCGFYCDYILRVFDSLHSLMMYSRNSENRLNMDMIVKNISRCLEELDNVVSVEHIQSSPSSFLGVHPTFQSDHPSVYASYPLPGNALVFDIVCSSAKSLGVNIP